MCLCSHGRLRLPRPLKHAPGAVQNTTDVKDHAGEAGHADVERIRAKNQMSHSRSHHTPLRRGGSDLLRHEDVDPASVRRDAIRLDGSPASRLVLVHRRRIVEDRIDDAP
jgi:hypothetical protein